MAEVLAHPFLNAANANNQLVPALPMQYHAFLSHKQLEASGTVGTMYFAYAQLGVHSWLDMKQKNLTLEGMRQGVRDSDVFFLVLTATVVQSWYCQQVLCVDLVVI